MVGLGVYYNKSGMEFYIVEPMSDHMRNKDRQNYESIRFWRASDMGDIELLHASYVRQQFNRHYHEGYAVGVIESGVLGFDYLGRNYEAEPGQINLAIPGEPHNGFAGCRAGWCYRMFYLDTGILKRAAAEAAGRSCGPPIFNSGVIDDPSLALEIYRLHCYLENADAPLIDRESRLLAVLAGLITRHAENQPAPPRAGNEHQSVARARDYLHAHYQDNLSLDDLSREAGLSRFHQLRVFKKETGLPPHAYLTHVRLGKAKEMLANGRPIVDAAMETGFVDQSHLNRMFKRTYGVTPGVYSKTVQDE